MVMENIFDQDPKLKHVVLEATVEVETDDGKTIEVDRKLVIDATVNEEHTRTAQVTKHPIDGGNNTSDHRIKQDVIVILTGVISDDPITISAAAIGTASGAAGSLIGGIGGSIATGALSKLGSSILNDKQGGRVKSAYEILKELDKQSSLVTITTGLDVYFDMVLTSLSFPRDQSTYRALRFTAIFQQLDISYSVTVETFNASYLDSSVRDSATPKKGLGNQSTLVPGTEATTKGSSILNKIRLWAQ